MQSLADCEAPSDLPGNPSPIDKSIRRAESLRRAPLEAIVLARQALQVRCACVCVLFVCKYSRPDSRWVLARQGCNFIVQHLRKQGTTAGVL